MSLSVCILHKNEMMNLIRAVSSINEMADEIIIIDSGNHNYDALSAYSKKTRVYKYESEGYFDFARARNQAMYHASSDWIFVLDSDEVVDNRNAAAILSAVNSNQLPAYALSIVNFYKNGFLSIFPVTRLYKKLEGLKYSKAIHETINYSLAERGITPEIVGIYVGHYGFLSDIATLFDKHHRYLDALDKQLLITPHDTATMWHKATSYRILGEKEKALHALQTAIKWEPENKIPKILLSRMLLDDKEYDLALTTIKSILESPSQLYWNPTVQNLHGMALFESGKVDASLACFKDVLQSQPWSIAAKLNIAIACSYLGRYDEGIRICEELLTLMPELKVDYPLLLEPQPFDFQRDVLLAYRDNFHGRIDHLYAKLIANN